MAELAHHPDPLRRWNTKLALVSGGMLAALLLGAVALPSGCLSQTLFGVPCPGCGLSRSVLATLHGELGSAFRLHPLGPAVAAAFVLLFLGSATRVGFAAWQWIVSICFFPIGLLSLLAGRQPTTCSHCKHAFTT